MITRVGIGAVACLAALLAACGSVRRSEALDGPMHISDPEVARGRVVFAANCHRCHPGGEPGLGPGLNDKPLPKFLIRFQVRHGLGRMPSFSEREISDEDLHRLVAYLKARRAAG